MIHVYVGAARPLGLHLQNMQQWQKRLDSKVHMRISCLSTSFARELDEGLSDKSRNQVGLLPTNVSDLHLFIPNLMEGRGPATRRKGRLAYARRCRDVIRMFSGLSFVLHVIIEDHIAYEGRARSVSEVRSKPSWQPLFMDLEECMPIEGRLSAWNAERTTEFLRTLSLQLQLRSPSKASLERAYISASEQDDFGHATSGETLETLDLVYQADLEWLNRKGILAFS